MALCWPMQGFPLLSITGKACEKPHDFWLLLALHPQALWKFLQNFLPLVAHSHHLALLGDWPEP